MTPHATLATASSKGTTASRSRDDRIDWLRGLALVTIFINHMPGNRFENWTSRNFGFSDASELFVLLAGVAVAFAFFRRFERGAVHEVVDKSIRRAGKLYALHLASTAGAVVIFATAAWLLSDQRVYEAIGVNALIADPVGGAGRLLVGTLQLGYFNILPMYIVLSLFIPALLWLAVRDVRLMLAVSLALYFATHLLPIALPGSGAGGGWFFNPLAWQLVYAVGIALGILKLRGETIGWNRWLGLAAALYVGYAFVWMIAVRGWHVTGGLLPGWIDTLDKGMLPLSRLLHIVSLAYLLLHSPLWGWMRRIKATDRLTLLGRNSLPVFVTGSLLSMIGWITIAFSARSLLLDLTLIVAGVSVMLLVARINEARLLQQALANVERRLIAGVPHLLVGLRASLIAH